MLLELLWRQPFGQVESRWKSNHLNVCFGVIADSSSPMGDWTAVPSGCPFSCLGRLNYVPRRFEIDWCEGVQAGGQTIGSLALLVVDVFVKVSSDLDASCWVRDPRMQPGRWTGSNYTDSEAPLGLHQETQVVSPSHFNLSPAQEEQQIPGCVYYSLTNIFPFISFLKQPKTKLIQL